MFVVVSGTSTWPTTVNPAFLAAAIAAFISATEIGRVSDAKPIFVACTTGGAITAHPAPAKFGEKSGKLIGATKSGGDWTNGLIDGSPAFWNAAVAPAVLMTISGWTAATAFGSEAACWAH